MNEVITNILNRRAIRKYKPEQILESELEQILTAGLYAPSAGSRQSTKLLVCQDAEINRRLGAINRDDFYAGRTPPATGVYVSKDQPSIADIPTMTDGFYGAPTVITMFAPPDFMYAVHDSCVVAENMMLAAASLGIGSCMVGRAGNTFANEEGRTLMRRAGIDESYEATIHIVLGYPASTEATAKSRKVDRIVRVGGQD